MNIFLVVGVRPSDILVSRCSIPLREISECDVQGCGNHSLQVEVLSVLFVILVAWKPNLAENLIFSRKVNLLMSEFLNQAKNTPVVLPSFSNQRQIS